MHKVKKLLFYNIIVIFFLIIFFEIFLRLFTSINELGVEKNLFNLESKIRVHNKNIQSKVFGKISFIDNLGFRVPHINYQYKKNADSILVLGDSVSFGVGVLEEETFIGRLRKKYSNINIYNSSVAGHSNADHLQLLNIYNQEIEFSKIFLIYCLNDIVNASGVLTREDFYKKNYFLAKINIFLRNKSYLYIYVKSLLTDPQKRYWEYTAPLYKDQKSLDFLESSFYQFKKISENINKKIYVIILPYEYQTRKENCNSNNLFPQDNIKKILIKNNLDFIDLTQNFCEFKFSNEFFLKYDPVHLSVKGHKYVSQMLDHFLSKNNIN